MALGIALNYTSAGNLVGLYASSTISYVNFTFDSSYTNGGYAVTPAQLGLTTQIIEINSATAQKGGYYILYDTTYGTIRVMTDPASTGALTEVTSGSASLNGLQFNTAVIGW
jgi:hypothetical protein